MNEIERDALLVALARTVLSDHDPEVAERWRSVLRELGLDEIAVMQTLSWWPDAPLFPVMRVGEPQEG